MGLEKKHEKLKNDTSKNDLCHITNKTHINKTRYIRWNYQPLIRSLL